MAKQTNNVLQINQNEESGKNQIGDNQPPKNNKLTKADNHAILLYSAKKNIAKVIEEYSTLYPATISASASGKSNGARFVSAKTEIKKTIKIGNNGTQYQIVRCFSTISIKLNEFEQATIGNSNKAIETSYEINWAELRKPPKNAYFELLAQPAPIIP